MEATGGDWARVLGVARRALEAASTAEQGDGQGEVQKKTPEFFAIEGTQDADASEGALRHESGVLCMPGGSHGKGSCEGGGALVRGASGAGSTARQE